MQLKPIGTADTEPTVTLSLSKKYGLYLRIRDDDFQTITEHPLLTLSDFTGKWIQVYVEVLYKQGKESGSADSGYVKVILKDHNGVQLYPIASDPGLFYGNMFWSDAVCVRPKWGLYRAVSADFQPYDWQLFQNIQIWSK